jgi:hypothetical protein
MPLIAYKTEEPSEIAEKVPTPSFCAKSQNPVSVANTDVMDSATVRRMTKEIFFSDLEPSPCFPLAFIRWH